MPLRDHFHPPTDAQLSWQELHGSWPGVMAFRLNAILPSRYRSGPQVDLGTLIEVDVGAFDKGTSVSAPTHDSNGGGLAWEPARPTLLLDTETPRPPEFEVRIYDERRSRRLVAAVELVSPGNKDRPDSREAFVSKCHALLMQDVCVAIVDVVTERHPNLYGELAERIGAEIPALGTKDIYAVSMRGLRVKRGRWRVESWEHELAVGSPLPTLPLWLTDQLRVPLELEATYEETCRGLRIA